MKKYYTKPVVSVVRMASETSLLANSFDGEQVTVEPDLMEEGDGSDAVKYFNDYDDEFTWGDLWGLTNDL